MEAVTASVAVLDLLTDVVILSNATNESFAMVAEDPVVMADSVVSESAAVIFFLPPFLTVATVVETSPVFCCLLLSNVSSSTGRFFFCLVFLAVTAESAVVDESASAEIASFFLLVPFDEAPGGGLRHRGGMTIRGTANRQNNEEVLYVQTYQHQRRKIAKQTRKAFYAN
jgi:hypothetical protein